jgi:hypothetical protein
MRKQGSGFGFVILVVVLAVVLLLVARAWRSVAPTAAQIQGGDAPIAVEDHGEEEAGEAQRSGDLPDLNEMRDETDAHAQAVQEALEATE